MYAWKPARTFLAGAGLAAASAAAASAAAALPPSPLLSLLVLLWGAVLAAAAEAGRVALFLDAGAALPADSAPALDDVDDFD